MNDKKAQAAIELAVFGAILIFALGTIVRSAVGNSYMQNQTLKAMRMAMLASYNGSISSTDENATPASLSRNSASILFVEDRLSVDAAKYGSMDRAPQMANGSGTFSYQLMYPLEKIDVSNDDNIPKMDMYINGQHFPLTTAAYVPNRTLSPPWVTPNPDLPCVSPDSGHDFPYTSTVGNPLTPEQCRYNQCLRYAREWVSPQGTCTGACIPVAYTSTSFSTTSTLPSQQAPPNSCTPQHTACPSGGTPVETKCTVTCLSGPQDACIDSCITCIGTCSIGRCEDPATGADAQGQCVLPYKLFYSQAVNGTPQFYVPPPTCAPHPCKDQELSGDVVLQGTNVNPADKTNDTGDLEYDLLRNGNYYNPSDSTAVETQLPLCTGTAAICTTGCIGGVCQNGSGQCPSTCPSTCASTCACKDNSASVCSNTGGNNVPACTCPDGSTPQGSCALSCPGNPGQYCPAPTSTFSNQCLRAGMAWQWSATAGIPYDSTTGGVNMTGFDAGSDAFPSYDIDGRLKPVTIYEMSGYNYQTGAVTVSYEDFQGGDIDSTWDINSCTPKPGLQNDMTIYSFVNGSYLQIKEGKLYNPQTGQVVSSVNQHNNVDLIQRRIQLSHDTGRFCPNNVPGVIPAGSPINGSADPNPVEVCVADTSAADSCFCSPPKIPCSSGVNNFASTCYSIPEHVIYVRSRLEDRRGRSWLTDATGQLGIK